MVESYIQHDLLGFTATTGNYHVSCSQRTAGQWEESVVCVCVCLCVVCVCVCVVCVCCVCVCCTVCVCCLLPSLPSGLRAVSGAVKRPVGGRANGTLAQHPVLPETGLAGDVLLMGRILMGEVLISRMKEGC